MKHRQFSKEVKLSALRDLQSGKPMAEVCRQYDTNAETVRRWRREHESNPDSAFSGKGKAITAEAKQAQFERLVGQLYAENQLLKKVLQQLENLQAERALKRSVK
jgi:transposase-like protein